MAHPDILDLRRFAEELADIARTTALKWFRRPLNIERKSDLSPVTQADREVETRLKALVNERYPEHAFVGEEFGSEGGDSEFQWIVDPIDGTRQFITGVPLFGTLIGLLQNGLPILGVVDIPATHERWVGVRGRQTLMNGSVCESSQKDSIENASIFTTSPDAFSEDEWRVYDRLSQRCLNRRYGLDCYAYALLASGHVDMVMEAGLKAYDILPIVPVIEGAGGRVTDWQGRELSLANHAQVLAVANDTLHVEAIDAVRNLQSDAPT